MRDLVTDTTAGAYSFFEYSNRRGALGAPNFAVLRACGAEAIVVDDTALIAAMKLAWPVL